jgi:hypothetical protein
MRIIDESTKRVRISALPSGFQLGNLTKLLEKRGIPQKASAEIKDFVEAVISAIQEDLLLTKAERLDPANWRLNFVLADCAKFEAFACLRSMENYEIQVSVGALVSLRSFACELARPVRKDIEESVTLKQRLSRLFWSCFGRNNSVYDWSHLNDFVNEANPAATLLAKDAALLLFHHELAHVLFGHLGVVNPEPPVRRALEADADFNAGTMFAGRLIREKVGLKAIERRLTDASLLLGTLFKAISVKSNMYHLPTIRSVMYLMGGGFILEHFFQLSFSEAESLLYWEEQRNKHEAAFISNIRGKSLEKFVGTERKIAKDMEALKHKTLPLRDTYKENFLCSVVDARRAQAQEEA